jgi:AraC-like DNA-binding protein
MSSIIIGPYIRATTLINFKDEVLRYGVDGMELLRLAGIPADAITKPDSFISYRQLCNLYERAAVHTKNPNFGIDWLLSYASSDHPATGPLVLLGRFCKNMQDWAKLSQKYWSDATNGFLSELIDNEHNEYVTYRFYLDPLSPYSRQMAELLIANAFAVAKAVSGRETLTPVVVRFQHREPQTIKSHLEFFRCPIEFDAPHNEISFAREVLTYKTAGSLMLFKPLLGLYIRHRIRHLPTADDSIRSTIALAIGSMLGTGNCSLGYIAVGLGMSAKKLQRLLEKEDVKFSSIVDDVRQHTARHLLEDSNASVAKISSMLDYSSNPAFTLAFKRWTGLSPLQYRKKMREKSGSF